MSGRFEQFRLSLMPRPQRDAFSAPDLSREEYLRKVFGSEWSFEHYKKEFRYQPKTMGDGSALYALVARQGMIRENKPPEQGLDDDSHIGWLACAVIIDPVDHKDGQKVAFQVDKTVGKPDALIGALVNKINAHDPTSTYYIEIEPIIDTTPFWDFVAENNGEITSVTFELVAPNGIFSTGGDTADEMRRFREVLKARKVTSTFQNEDGLDIYAEPFKEATDYAARAGGKIRAKSKSGKRFNSTKKPKATIIPDEELDEAFEQEHILVRAARYLAEVFGR
ncbi:MAG: hypothetical protein PSX79_03895 [bacterium]|nr:hypothetical protein [bacterium]